MIGPGQQRPGRRPSPPPRRSRRHRRRPAPARRRGHRAAPDMDDHRLAMDIGQRLARQAMRRHAGGNDDERFQRCPDSLIGVARARARMTARLPRARHIAARRPRWPARQAWSHRQRRRDYRPAKPGKPGLRRLSAHWTAPAVKPLHSAAFGRRRGPGLQAFRRGFRMASLEVNKIAGAILLGGLVAMVTGFIAHELVNPERQGGERRRAQLAAAPAALGGPAPAPIEPVSGLIAKADVHRRSADRTEMPACHDFTKGGPNKIGPNLWGIVGSQPGRSANYAFTDAMKARESKTWTYEELNDFLTAPQGRYPGHQDDIPRPAQAAGPRQCHRLVRTLSDSPLRCRAMPISPRLKRPYDDAKAAAAEPAAPAATAPATSAAAPAGGTEPRPTGVHRSPSA